MKKCLFVIVALLEACAGVIYHLNDADYNLMPPLIYTDDYEKCVKETDWVYCMMDINIMFDETSQLSTMIQNYSKEYTRHFNYSILTRGVCVNKSCPTYSNSTTGVASLNHLEECIKEIIWHKYELKAMLLEQPICSSSNDTPHIGVIDKAVYCIFALIIIVNVAGSLTAVWYKNRQAPFLRCFSLSNNLKQLFETRNNCYENQVISLTSLDGIRCICMIWLIILHSALVTGNAANPRFLEQFYNWSIFYLIFNSHIVVNVFFMLSSFLLVYNKQFVASGCENIKLILSNITARILRLTPPYATVLLFNIACLKLFRNIETQLMWEKAVGVEIRHCGKYYLSHLMYINNYHLESQCMLHTWYIAADMQLYLLGVTVCVLAKRPVFRYLTLAALFIASLVLPALSTYYNNLHGNFNLIPESLRTFSSRNNDFLYLYRPGHMNLSSFIMGMVLAYTVKHLQKTNFNIQEYKKYTYIYWMMLPLVLIYIILGKMFYVETSRQPMWIRMAAAALYKPIFAFLISIIIFGQLFKLGVYSKVLGWSGWTPISRISYCVYLTQVTIIRLFYTNHTTLIHTSVYFLVLNFFSVLLVTLLAALVLWLTVEAPVSNLVRLYSTIRTLHRNGTKKQ